MSLDDGLSDLHKAHTAAHEKYTYWLLAAAGAGIGFAVQKTDGVALSWWALPIAAATFLWAGSFFCGCKNVEWVNTATSANYGLLQLRSGVHPKQPDHPQLVHAAESRVQAAIDRNISKAQRYAILQFRLFLAGSLCFIAWRALEMWRIAKLAACVRFTPFVRRQSYGK